MNPLTWQNPEQLFVAQVLKKIFYNSVAELRLSYGCPINKKVWSPTFVITTCGLASSFLALLIWIIDIKGYQGWCVFFRSFGVNPLFIYVFAEIMGILLGATGASVFIYEKVLVPVLGNYPGSLAYALLYVLFCWSIVHILYKKGIYVKI